MRLAFVLLLVFLALFGGLYFTETTYRDLWANLLASLIVILFVNSIVNRSEMQKNERSIRYAKGHIANVCIQSMWLLKPPQDWQGRLNQPNYDWKDYFTTVEKSRIETINKFEVFLGGYSQLVDSKLRNDLFDILNLLNSGNWTMPYMNIENKTDLMCLSFLIHDVVAVMNLSLETMKHHELMRYMGLGLRWKEGKPDTIDKPVMGEMGIQQNLTNLEGWLKESIAFRDRILKLMFPREDARSKQ